MASNRVLGVVIGAHAIKVAQVRTEGASSRGHSRKAGANNGGQPTFVVEKWGARPIPRGLVHDGRIAGEAIFRLSEELKSLVAGFDTRDAILGFGSSTATFMRHQHLPYVTPKDRKTAIPGILATKTASAGSSATRSVTSWSITAADPDEGLDLAVYSASEEHLEEVTAVARGAGLNVVGGDLSALALLRASNVMSRPEGQVDAIVDIGSTSITCLLHRSGVPVGLVIEPDLGGDALTARIAQALGVDTTRVDPAAAEEIAEVERAKETDTSKKGKIPTARHEYARIVASRVESWISAWAAAAGYPTLAKITLTGGGGYSDGLGYWLVNSLGSVPLAFAEHDPAIVFAGPGPEVGTDMLPADASHYLSEPAMGAYLAPIGLAMSRATAGRN